MIKLSDKINELYEMWLLDSYSDVICCKDDLIECVENGFMFDEFVGEVVLVLK